MMYVDRAVNRLRYFGAPARGRGSQMQHDDGFLRESSLSWYVF